MSSITGVTESGDTLSFDQAAATSTAVAPGAVRHHHLPRPPLWRHRQVRPRDGRFQQHRGSRPEQRSDRTALLWAALFPEPRLIDVRRKRPSRMASQPDLGGQHRVELGSVGDELADGLDEVVVSIVV